MAFVLDRECGFFGDGHFREVLGQAPKTILFRPVTSPVAALRAS